LHRRQCNSHLFAVILCCFCCYRVSQEAINESDIDQLIMGMVSQIAEREDNIVTPDLHGNVFGPLEFSRRDLMAVNIQRGRDHGLPDYNTAREFFGLPRITCWRDINPALYDEVSGSNAIQRSFVFMCICSAITMLLIPLCSVL